MWISGESLKKQGTKKGCARYLRLSAQMVRVHYLVVSRSRWDKAPKETGTHHGDKKRLLLQVKDSGKRVLEGQGVGWSSFGKNGYGRQGDRILGYIAPT